MVKGKKILITGVSGFLGSALLPALLINGYEVMATRRAHTNNWRCDGEGIDAINWVDIDSKTFKETAIAFAPNIIIHFAWIGVTSTERVKWSKQMENFHMLGALIDIMQKVDAEKFIAIGSQAEYGTTYDKVNENSIEKADNAYASCKLAAKQIVKSFCELNKIEWYWLRVFSVFGPKEDDNWFIPAMIINQLNKVESNVTLCEQKYDYLYIDDFVAMAMKVLLTENKSSGVYNICSGETMSLRTILEQLKKAVNNDAIINYGAVPYRIGQSMYIGGDNSKFHMAFGIQPLTDFKLALDNTVAYFRSRYVH